MKSSVLFLSLAWFSSGVAHGDAPGQPDRNRSEPAETVVSARHVDVRSQDRERILKAAAAAMEAPPITITDFPAKTSEGGPNDFHSNADYWWPDPAQPDGHPYVRRDGQSNPANFNQHRMALRNLRDSVAALAAAWQITADRRYSRKASEMLRIFFIDEKTRMNPNLEYAQSIPGTVAGRGYGIIDALHLIEIPAAVERLRDSPDVNPELLAGMKSWFSELTTWMLTSNNGREEAETKNNHAVAFWLQIACYARFTADEAILAECRRRFKEVFLPGQMAADGSFPLELARTKPYAYSIFQFDNMATLCHVLSTPEEDLWAFELADGRCMRKAAAYLYPYLKDKSKWPLKPDVMAWDGWPSRQPGLLFAGIALGNQDYLDLWSQLRPDPENDEVRRNIPITQPVLWVAP